MKRYYDSSISFHIAFMTEILFFNFAAAVTARIIFNDFKTFFEHKREQEHLKFSNSNSISEIKILIVRTIFPLRKIFQSINRRVLSILKKLHEFLSLSLTKCETPDSMRYKWMFLDSLIHVLRCGKNILPLFIITFFQTLHESCAVEEESTKRTQQKRENVKRKRVSRPSLLNVWDRNVRIFFELSKIN